MDLLVECLLCKEVIKCQPNDTFKLVDHVKLKHSDIKIGKISREVCLFTNFLKFKLMYTNLNVYLVRRVETN